MAADQLSKGNDDGTLFGQSASDKIGFFGLTTPIVQPTVTGTVTTVSATSTSPYGFTTQAQADHIVSLVNYLQEAIVALGLAADGS